PGGRSARQDGRDQRAAVAGGRTQSDPVAHGGEPGGAARPLQTVAELAGEVREVLGGARRDLVEALLRHDARGEETLLGVGCEGGGEEFGPAEVVEGQGRWMGEGRPGGAVASGLNKGSHQGSAFSLTPSALARRVQMSELKISKMELIWKPWMWAVHTPGAGLAMFTRSGALIVAPSKIWLALGSSRMRSMSSVG